MANESISAETESRSAETERLLLRRNRKNDLQDLFEYLSDEKVVEYEPYRPIWKDTYVYAKLSTDR